MQTNLSGLDWGVIAIFLLAVVSLGVQRDFAGAS